jgi:hypothetical protein
MLREAAGYAEEIGLVTVRDERPTPSATRCPHERRLYERVHKWNVGLVIGGSIKIECN